jgi:N-acetylated-alpha-linked acidic dipeptidase
MRLADADILPYDFSPLSDTVHQYSDEVKALLKARQDEAIERQSDIESDVYRIASDPKRPTVAPPALDTPPYLNFAPLDNALALLDKAAAHYNTARAKAEVGPVSRDQLKTVNEQLAQTERKLTSPQGLPRRPWMRHLLYAPGRYTGYDPKTLPGVREAIEERRYAEAEAQIALVAQALTDEAAYIEQLAKELESASTYSHASQSAVNHNHSQICISCCPKIQTSCMGAGRYRLLPHAASVTGNMLTRNLVHP